MEIREFAARVLHSERLEDKLLAPGALTDHHPGPAERVPVRPGRPIALGFGREKIPFPHAERLELGVTRGQVLHFFANHELLALELMALVLLRFPEAPSRFRRGLVHTMLDEQRHLAAYIARMQSLGVELGSLGLSEFFWSALKDTPSPLHFVAAMSLTLEQANLDFMIEYRRAFRAVGDEETAGILDRVLCDEIRHVRHGHRWFERWRPRAEGSFAEYRALIQHPLTPARAKGRRLDRDVRTQAGLSEEFINSVLAFRASKGRPPLVYVPNFDAEDRIAKRGGRVPESVIGDLAPLLGFIAHQDDVVMVPRAPRVAFLANLASVGLGLPEMIVAREPEEAGRILADRPPAGFEPWADLERTPAGLWSKTWATRFSARPAERRPVRSASEALRAAHDLLSAGHREVVVKAGLSAAGRHRAWWQTVPSLAEVEPLLAVGDAVVEPWRDRVLDLGVLIDTRKRAPLLETMRFLTDARGQYKGHVLGARWDDLPKDLQQFLFRPTTPGGKSALQQLEDRAMEVARALGAEGYQGPASVDAMVYRGPEGFRLEPVVEVNPRRTMGFIARAMARHLAPRRSALWLHLSRRDAKRLGFQDLKTMARAFEARSPLELQAGRSTTSIGRGVLFTTDPETSQNVVTVLIVGESLLEVDRMLVQPSMLRSIQAVFS